MKKVTIFGATGFVGSAIAKAVCKLSDVEVTALVRNPA